jgi:hypothetical protein
MSDASGQDSSLSDDDTDPEIIDEAADIRVVQSSMHASVLQQISKPPEIVKNNENQEKIHAPVENQDPKEQGSKITEGEQEIQDVGNALDRDQEEENFKILDKEEEKQKIEQSSDTENILNPPQVRLNFKIEEKKKTNESNNQKELDLEIKNTIKSEPEELKTNLAKNLPKKTQKNHKNHKKIPYKLDVEKRFYEYQSKVDKKIEMYKEEKKIEELKLCTFAPKIQTKTEKRKFNQFLDHIKGYEKRRKENLEQIKREKEEKDDLNKNTFKPILSEGTLKLTSAIETTEVICERLYKEHKVLKKKQEILSKELLKEYCPFKPKLNEQSAALKREGDTTQRLYEISKEKPKELPIETHDMFISPDSEKIMVEKVIKEINECIKPDPESSGLSYSDYLNVLEKLHLVRNDVDPEQYTLERELASKGWKSIGGEDDTSVPLDKIQEFIVSIMNLNKSKSTLPVKKIHKEYILMYNNKKKYVKTPTKPDSPFSFKPTLDETSQKIAAEVKQKRISDFGNDKIENILVNQHKKSQEEIEKKRKIKELDMPKDCTFKPKIERGPVYSEEDFRDSMSLASDYLKLSSENLSTRTEILYNFSKIKSERKDKISRTLEEMEYEKNMNECSFVPSLEKPKFISHPPNEAKGVAESIDRLKKARADSQTKSPQDLQPMKFGVESKKK